MKQIEFFFDYLSPYSYIAFSKFIKRKIFFDNYSVIYTPVIMSQVIHAWETLGPAEIAPKRDYLMKNCLRVSQRESIPFKVPLHLPFNSLDALRYTLAKEWKSEQASFIESCFRFCWQERGDTNDFDAFKFYMLKAGFNLENVEVKPLRRELKQNTKRAIDMKLFGVPTFVVDESELFWGSDSIEDLVTYLEGNCLIKESEEYSRYESLF